MKKIFITLIFCVLATVTAFAQTTVSGQVTDKDGGDAVIGVNIIVKGKVVGTTTDVEGKFTFSTNIPTPFTLIFSGVGYGSKEVEVTASGQEIKLEMSEEITFGQEVVISASRMEEKILESPVTVEKMDIIAIQQTSTHDFYDGIGKLKGVHTNQGSLTFTTVNTRGFAALGNTRFVQLIDGMDNSAPLLGFPAGNVIGISELDIESVELVPGAASALYGPNAFNGILFMNSKSPFEYQGLSVQLKGGATSSDAGGSNGYQNASIRYAKAFNDKFAFKVNLSILDAQDWRANDYDTDRAYPANSANQPGTNNFDGLNLYGDESGIVVPMAVFAANPAFIDAFAPAFGGDRALAAATIASLPTLVTRRTGFKEQDLLDNNDAKSLKVAGGLFYRLTDNLELSYNFRYGKGSTVYQGSERYALRDFTMTFNKIELKSSNFFIRAYMSSTDDGDSYNLTALGGFSNEAISPTRTQWLPTYAGTYAGALLQGADLTAAHVAARNAADASRPAVGSPEFNAIVEKVRGGLFGQGGAGFVDDSKMFHTEFNYNFGHLTDVVEVQVGGNYRKYDLFSANTVFNEDPEGTGNPQRIGIGEFGVYTQVSKRIANDRLKLTASIRYDKNENFDGQVTPRASMVYSAGENREHNFRASFQTGFRNPSTQGQFIYFPTTTVLLGGTKANAERYGIHNGGSWSFPSYQAFVASAIAGAPDPSLLETINFDYVQPEQLTAYEVGYKGLISGKLLLDVNYYYNKYTNFITQINVVSKEDSPYLPKGTVFRPYLNVDQDITSTGFGLGLSYKLPKGFVFGGNYSFADFKLDAATDFEPGFNTPKNRFNLSLSNREVAKNLGFNIGLKWQEEFYWENSFGSSIMPSYSSLDAQVSYKVKSIKTVFKIGGSNIGGKQYRSNTGGPFVGSLYYLSINFDQFLN